ncbi:hypothetical protein Hanom_Chr14g01325571 [Helianthus anomalus]
MSRLPNLISQELEILANVTIYLQKWLEVMVSLTINSLSFPLNSISIQKGSLILNFFKLYIRLFN